MAQDEQFDILRGLATPAGHDECKQYPEGRIQSTEQHLDDHAGPGKRRDEVLEPTGNTCQRWCLIDLSDGNGE